VHDALQSIGARPTTHQNELIANDLYVQTKQAADVLVEGFEESE
jgi:hypothetical protein